MKLEIGSGINPQTGYIHLDCNKDFPDVDIVCDITKERIPVPDGTVTEILANHVIEHIPWRLLPFVISEWSRVCSSGGNIVIRTPDLEFICRKYLAGEMTPESTPDEDAMRDVFGEYGPSQWAIIKLFSGQDYPSNFHFNAFDFNSMRNLLEKHGFGNILRIHLEPVFSPGELQIKATKLI